jgi:hypothetical protein
MTTMAEQMAADLDFLFDTDVFAQVVTYNDGTTSASVNGIVDYGEVGGSGNNAVHGATITVKKSDVPDPGYRHTFTIDGNVWQVAMDNSRPRVRGDGLVWEIDLVRDERNNSWRT